MVESVSTSKYGTPSNVVTFQEKLRQGRTTSTWLDEQLGSPLNFNPARAARKTRRSSPKETKPSVKKSATQEAVESATTQIVNKALRLLKKDTTSGPDVSKAPETPDSLMIGSKVCSHVIAVGLKMLARSAR